MSFTFLIVQVADDLDVILRKVSQYAGMFVRKTCRSLMNVCGEHVSTFASAFSHEERY